MLDRKSAHLFQPDHLQLESRLSGRLTTVVDSDRRDLIPTDMQVFPVWHGFECIQIKVELHLVCTRIGRTELPVAGRIFTQFPMMFQDKTGMAESLYKRTDLDIPFFRITAERLHLLLTDRIRGTYFRTAGKTQLVFQFPDNRIHFITCQPINHSVIIFHPVQMMLRIEMDSTVGNGRIIGYLHLRNFPSEIAAILQQLLQCLATIEKTRFRTCRHNHPLIIHHQNISFGRIGDILPRQLKIQSFSPTSGTGKDIRQRSQYWNRSSGCSRDKLKIGMHNSFSRKHLNRLRLGQKLKHLIQATGIEAACRKQ